MPAFGLGAGMCLCIGREGAMVDGRGGGVDVFRGVRLASVACTGRACRGRGLGFGVELIYAMLTTVKAMYCSVFMGENLSGPTFLSCLLMANALFK